MFRELYLREDRRKDPESFSMDGPKVSRHLQLTFNLSLLLNI
jgi:hypothetical protein